jgi:hypothetical protein
MTPTIAQRRRQLEAKAASWEKSRHTRNDQPQLVTRKYGGRPRWAVVTMPKPGTTAWTWFDREDLARAELGRLGGDRNMTPIRGASVRSRTETATAPPGGARYGLSRS